MKTDWTPRYEKLIADLEREVPRHEFNYESVPKIVSDLRDELHYLMSQFNAFTNAQYREFFARLKQIEQKAMALASLPPTV